MTVHPDPERVNLPADSPRLPTRRARWAVGLAGAVAVVVTVSYAIFGVAYAVGGDDAISDTWVGALAGAALLGGLAVSLIAFALAVASKVRHERWTPLWLPLSVFPVLLVLVTPAEVFLIE
jgi:hypothetical protein